MYAEGAWILRGPLAPVVVAVELTTARNDDRELAPKDLIMQPVLGRRVGLVVFTGRTATASQRRHDCQHRRAIL